MSQSEYSLGLVPQNTTPLLKETDNYNTKATAVGHIYIRQLIRAVGTPPPFSDFRLKWRNEECTVIYIYDLNNEEHCLFLLDLEQYRPKEWDDTSKKELHELGPITTSAFRVSSDPDVKPGYHRFVQLDVKLGVMELTKEAVDDDSIIPDRHVIAAKRVIATIDEEGHPELIFRALLGVANTQLRNLMASLVGDRNNASVLATFLMESPEYLWKESVNSPFNHDESLDELEENYKQQQKKPKHHITPSNLD